MRAAYFRSSHVSPPWSLALTIEEYFETLRMLRKNRENCLSMTLRIKKLVMQSQRKKVKPGEINRRFGVINTSLKRELGNESTNRLSMTPEHQFFSTGNPSSGYERW